MLTAKKYKFVERLKKHDSAAIKELYEIAFAYCSKYVLKNTGTLRDAENMFQETLVVLYNNIQKEDFTLTANIKTYLYGINRRLWLKYLRDVKGKNPKSIDPESYPELEDDVSDLEKKEEKEEMFLAMERAFQHLKEDCQKVIDLFHYKGKSYKEIAQILDYKESFIGKKLRICREKLKNLMQG